MNPAPYTALDAGGPKAWFGWPDSPEVQARIADWYAAADLDAEKKAMAALNRASFDNVTYAPTGFFQTAPTPPEAPEMVSVTRWLAASSAKT